MGSPRISSYFFRMRPLMWMVGLRGYMYHLISTGILIGSGPFGGEMLLFLLRFLRSLERDLERDCERRRAGLSGDVDLRRPSTLRGLLLLPYCLASCFW